jgi:hypothetical protein
LRTVTLALFVTRTVAVSDPQPPASSLGSLIVDNTPFDYLVDGILFLWFIGAIVLYSCGSRMNNDEAKIYSLAIMLVMAVIWIMLVSEGFAAGIHWT